jgi:hypothetical protein
MFIVSSRLAAKRRIDCTAQSVVGLFVLVNQMPMVDADFAVSKRLIGRHATGPSPGKPQCTKNQHWRCLELIIGLHTPG